MNTSAEIRRAKNSIAQRKCHARDPQKYRDLTAAWRAANPDKVKDYAVRWRAKNAERVAEYRAINKVKQRVYSAAWYAERSFLINQRRRTKYAINPTKYDDFTARNNLRRARRKTAAGTHTAADIRMIFALQRGRCAACCVGVAERYQVDHILPLKLGGSNAKENLQILCEFCNKAKYIAHPIDFMQRRGFLL